MDFRVKIFTSSPRPILKTEIGDHEGDSSVPDHEDGSIAPITGGAERAMFDARLDLVEQDEMAEIGRTTSLSLLSGNFKKAQILSNGVAQETLPDNIASDEDNVPQQSSGYRYFGHHDDDSSNEAESEKAQQYKFQDKVGLFTQRCKLGDGQYHALQSDILAKVEACLELCGQIKNAKPEEKNEKLGELRKKIDELCNFLTRQNLSDEYMVRKSPGKSKQTPEPMPYEISRYMQSLEGQKCPQNTLKNLKGSLEKIKDKLYKDLLLEKFQELNKSGNFNLDAASFMASFVLHAIGVKILYSQQVNEVYYHKKRDYLAKEEGEVRSDLLSLLYRSCFQACKAYLISLIHKVCEASETKDYHLQSTWSKNVAELVKFDGDSGEIYCLTTLSLLGKAVGTQEKVADLIGCNEVKDLLQKIVNGLKDSQALLNEQEWVNDTDLLYDNFVNQLGKFKIHQLKEKFPNTHEFLKTRFKPATVKVSTKIGSLSLADKPLLIKAYIKDINVQVVTLLGNPGCQAAIENLLKEKLQHELETRSNRKTLGLYHEFVANDKGIDGDHFIDFMSNVRLSNRSQIREAKNNQPLLLKGPEKIIYKEENFYRTWSFGKQVLEKLSLTGKGQTRIDMVHSAGSYVAIFELVEGFKNYFNKISKNFISDAQVAQWIKEIVAGKQLSKLGICEEQYNEMMFGQSKINKLKEKLAGIAYLLFGCEVARNPASILVHKMMVDLIERGDEQYTWKIFLVHESPSAKKNKKGENIEKTELKTGGKMPMSVEGAVSAGRYLNQIFREYLPYPYTYPGIDEPARVQDMVSNEAWVLRNWMLCKDYLYQYDLNYDGNFEEVPLAAKVNLETNKVFKNGKAIGKIPKYCVISVTDKNKHSYFLECLGINFLEDTTVEFTRVSLNENYTTKNNKELYQALGVYDRSAIFEGVTTASESYLVWLFEELERV